MGRKDRERGMLGVNREVEEMLVCSGNYSGDSGRTR